MLFDRKNNTDDTSLTKVKFKIDGMHCTSCSMNIDMDLEDLEGIKEAKTSYAKEETEVEFDAEKVKIEQIFEQIQQTGYKAQVKE